MAGGHSSSPSGVYTNTTGRLTLVLVEAIALLKLDRRSEIAALVLACFAIGLGAALTPETEIDVGGLQTTPNPGVNIPYPYK